MYTPAISEGISEKIRNKAYPCLTSLALCLEDSINDDSLEAAEIQLVKTLIDIKTSVPKEDRPLLFVRIRTPEHMLAVHNMIRDSEDVLTGYILPKFDLDNAKRYIEVLTHINNHRMHKLYIMPTLESGMVADAENRIDALTKLKDVLAPIRNSILNIRVGGNDFSNLFGVRRKIHQTIYDIGVIRDILSDIINVFSREYVISGPVWEYFGNSPDGAWAAGLKREISLDIVNGFTGKTAIHPSQLPVIYESLKVSKEDYNDAQSILAWNRRGYAVAKSAGGTRMNEVKCHTRWAEKISCMGQIYGITEEA